MKDRLLLALLGLVTRFTLPTLTHEAGAPELTLRRLWPDQFKDLILFSILEFNYCPVRQRHGIERFIGPGLLKRNQPETQRLNLEFKTHNLKRPVPVGPVPVG